MDLTTELLEQIEANSARTLVLVERIARVVLDLAEKDAEPDERRRKVTKARLAMVEALGVRG